jgi:hypothetical protein
VSDWGFPIWVTVSLMNVGVWLIFWKLNDIENMLGAIPR